MDRILKSSTTWNESKLNCNVVTSQSINSQLPVLYSSLHIILLLHMKVFRSSNMEVIAECQRHFEFTLSSELIEKKKTKPLHNYNNIILL